MGWDNSARKVVRFAAVDSYSVISTAGTTAHARILVGHGLPSDVGNVIMRSRKKLPPKSDGDLQGT